MTGRSPGYGTQFARMLCALVLGLALCTNTNSPAVAQGGSEANALFVEAVQLYRQSGGKPEQEAAADLARVRELFDRILQEYPDSTAAEAISTQPAPAGVEIARLPPSRPSPDAELAGYPLPDSVTGAIGIVARAACGDETGACVDEVTLALAEYIFRWAFDGERLAQVEQLQWLFANPGRFDDNLARIGAFDAALTDTAFREEFVDRVNGRVLRDIRRDVARKFAMTLVTGVVSEALARHYEATGQAEAAAFTRRWFEPMVEIALVVEGAATPASLAAGTVYIWARNAYAFWHLGESQYRAEEAGATREEQLTRLAAEIDSYSRTLVSGRLTGSAFPDNQGEPLTERHAEILRSVLEQHLELQRWWLESGDAALLETFEPVLSFARDFYEMVTTEQPLDAADGTGALPPDLVPAPAPSGNGGQGTVVFGLPVTPESIRAAVDRYRASFADLCALPSVRESGLTCPGVVGACKGEGCIGRGPFRAREAVELLEAPGSTTIVARLRPGDWVFSEHAETWYVPCRTVRQEANGEQSPGLPPVGTVRWRKNYLGEGISVYHSPTGDQQYFDPDFREVPDAPSQAMDPCHYDNQPTWYLVTTASGQMGWVDTSHAEFDGMGHFSGDDMTGALLWTLDRVETGENLYGRDNLYARVATRAEVDSGPPDHWVISTEPRLTLSHHAVVQDKLALAPDNSVTVFGAPYLPAIAPSYAPDYQTELHLFPSPDGRASIVVQREASSGWGSRAILLNDDTRTAHGRDLIPRARTQGVDNARDVIFVDGPVAWSPGSRYAILRYSPSEHEFRALLFDRETGRTAVMQPPDMQSGTWADVQIDSLRVAGGGVHEITFRTFRCANANCEGFTRTADHVHRFQLESDGPTPLPSLTISAADAIAQLGDGLYGRSPESCGLELPEEGGNWGFHLRQLRMPEYYLGDAVTCTIRGAEYRGDRIEIDAACTAEGVPESRTHHWTILSTTSFRDHGAQGGPADYVLCEAAPPEPQRQEWTEAIVHPGGYGRPKLTGCMWQSPSAGVDCLRADGASEETLRFARARVTEGGEGPVVPIAFQELGQVDIAVLDALTMNGNQIDYFVNTAPETISYPMYPETDLAVLASRGDRRARAVLAKYPGAMHWRSFVGGMRVLPNGHQRFSTVIYWTENCRACPIVGYNLATVDFDQTGRFRAFQAHGIFDNRRYRRLMSLSASDLQRDSAAIQFQLNLRGYDAGPMDGVMGPRSRAALAEFQREHGINSGTGQPDIETLIALVNRATMFSNGASSRSQIDLETSPDSGTVSNFAAPNGYAWLQLASRNTLDEARTTAQQFEGARIFGTQSGWYAISVGPTETFVESPENLARSIEEWKRANNYPDDAFLTAGSTYTTEYPVYPGDSVVPAFLRTSLLRDSMQYSRHFQGGMPVYQDIQILTQGSPVILWGRPDWERGDCLVDGHEGIFIKCADIAAIGEAQSPSTTQSQLAFQLSPETDFTVSRDGAGIHFHFPRNEIRRLLANLSNGDLASTDFSVTVGETTMVACTHFLASGTNDPSNFDLNTLEELRPMLQCNAWSRDGADSFAIIPGSSVSIDVSGYPIDPVVMTLETTPLIEGIMTEGQSCDFRIGNNLGQYSHTRIVPCGLPRAPDPNAEFYRLYAESDGPAFAARLIERSRWRNSPEQRDHLGRMLFEMISTDPDSDSTGDLSRMAAIMHDIAVDAGGDGEMVRVMNYARNTHQDDHPTRAAVLSPDSGWNGPVPDGEKEFHVIGIADRADVEKYTHPDGREAVFLRDGSGNWQVMRDGTNDATFNLVPNSNRDPESIYQHLILDVIPWMLYGVSPADSTSLRDRIAAFERSGMLSTVRTLYGPVADITDAIESVPSNDLATGPLTALNNRPENPGSPEGNADLTSAIGALDAAESVTDTLRAAWEVFRLARSYESYALLRADWTAAASQVSDAGRLVTTQALQSVGTAGVTIMAELILKDVMVDKLMRCPCRLNGETFTNGQADSLVDSFFNLVTADLPGQIIDQSLNIARAAIEVRQTNDGYVDAVKGAARTTLSRYESGEITGDQFAQAIAYSRSLNDDFRDQRTFLALNLIPANRGEIVLQLAEIKVEEGPLGLSTLTLGDFLDQLRRFGLSDLGAQSFAEEIANEFGLQSWPVR
ncbi:peptidoglycan-binding protein [Ruegeria pomeroyi]|uniref:Peptidoglycan-binding protein n=1 Tax=Ruegeria pomeroyi TaxID=89184 RepID=A0A9Q3ZLB8_9RHOB|nr:peptidoglycan-binding protein [Ruegeria pomeroyi]MCE8536833.1 peptidoglycan-binding protein [Ruegeria pomeroyi]